MLSDQLQSLVRYFNFSFRKVNSVEDIPARGRIDVFRIVDEHNARSFFRRDAAVGEDKLDLFGPAGVGHAVNDAFGRKDESAGRA